MDPKALLSGSIGHQIGFMPYLPLWAIDGLAVAAVLGAVLGAVRHVRGLSARSAALLVVLAWLAGPQWVTRTWHPLGQTALVIDDQSASMGLNHRRELARDIISGLQAESARVPGLTLKVIASRGGTPDTHGTRLFDALTQAAADIPPDRLSGVVFLTDGQVHDVPHGIPAALRPTGSAYPLPLNIMLTGRGEETDRRLRVLSAPPYAIVGQTATIRVEVDQSGPALHAADDLTTLTITAAGEEPIHAQVRANTPQDIPVPVRRPGPLLIGLSATELPNEVSALNNSTIVTINGVRDRLKVLLVSGTPNQGERVWRRLLKADPSVDLVHFTILRPPDKDDGTPLSDMALIAFPVRELFEQKIRQFDLIILDGFQNRAILPPAYLRNIASYVRGGGGLLLIAGPEFVGAGSLQDTAVGSVLPAHVPSDGALIEQAFKPTLTAVGERHPVTSGLPQSATTSGPTAAPDWGPWYRALRPDSTQGETLLTGPDNAPLLILDHVDQGRVALLLSDQIWLWSHGEGGGGPQSELLRRLSHWLMKEPELEEEQLTATINDGRLIATRRSTHTADLPTLSVRSPDGHDTHVALHDMGNGVATVGIEATQPGIWQVDDGAHRAFAAPAINDALEYSDLRATASPLSPLASQTGGSVVWSGNPAVTPRLALVEPGTAPQAGALMLADRHARSIAGEQSRALLPGWLVLALAALLLALGWWRESKP
ncbi:hypothetical protein AA103196_2332 [Ameyamaea chiangmaiensis NBRC 103196]|uniref:VWA domain-containing protein n=1 Tax=Ameyamaea chiangmaiensis TaxID=442969 RepID=A0A850P8T7_9PROT|nr:VWA domain-containing protein [Ameyamaea chiangmaiensis]MBS4075409.1 VWA domain-containing protein [Ameyamaea chiangmaiensis]NVN40318.1 VWA domain-containing protein [Ameyamaea chiangmaiensis]GBQ69855.1 hypothetical protein AA103196_2332 [Ameyamaea chiangmaiensis NBRC 103196]